MSHLLEFYRGSRADTEGRLLKDIWTWDDDSLEEVHDYIQWLFPLSEPSQFNPDAPLLTEGDIAAFKADQVLQANLAKSFERILSFLGLTLADDGKIAEGDNFSLRFADVWAWPNHNWLRISRILRSLTMLGMEVQAKALYDQLSAFYRNRRFPIPANSFQFWTDAVTRTNGVH
jgi:hypothetical protein